ncbi:MAG TPA: thioester domain-containing protein [Actinophytocola sp.]|uniref:thioester domain-containing protein n=1 Tax=Actinophytocola sp. TaxID=1872138 RepID=UPI002DB85806|nr:thioester domain-containing protein [Actinophytocola sp.]HEU5471136.1 thioester domain-containing protein [Actinophytocola sp.]
MARRFRLGAAVAGIAVVGMLAAAPASAEGVSGTAPGTGTEGFRVNVGGVGDNPETMLIDLKLANGANLKVYCVQIRTDLDNSREAMVEVPWEQFPDTGSPFARNSDRLNGVLHNGFPVKSLAELTKALTAAGVRLSDGLSAEEAITATQAAVWHFSDGTDLNEADPLVDLDNRAIEQDVLALYRFLLDDKNTGGAVAPKATLEFSPAQSAGDPGTKIGPFTVATNGKITELAADVPDGVRIIDKAGNPVDAKAIKNGSEIFFEVPADAAPGAGSVELTAEAQVATGRLFIGKGGRAAQALIVAASDDSVVTATATATFGQDDVAAGQVDENPEPQAAANQDDLATTGASTLIPISLGVGLLAGGTLLLLLRRRRI